MTGNTPEVIDWLTVVVELRAKKFKQTPEYPQLTFWCDAQELLTDRQAK